MPRLPTFRAVVHGVRTSGFGLARLGAPAGPGGALVNVKPDTLIREGLPWPDWHSRCLGQHGRHANPPCRDVARATDPVLATCKIAILPAATL
jgi:hypothetical protein